MKAARGQPFYFPAGFISESRGFARGNGKQSAVCVYDPLNARKDINLTKQSLLRPVKTCCHKVIMKKNSQNFTILY